MFGKNDFRNSVLIAAAIVFLGGCGQQEDEVSKRTENIDFVAEKPAPVEVKKPVPVANPINTVKREGILPTKLEIPAIEVKSEILHLGLTETGEMAVPDNGEEVSWFSHGYQPGENGRAVIAGHVDDLEGPAIFWDLSKLKAGDEILVAEGDKQLRFKVYKMESVPLDNADLSSIFGYQSSPELVLITCAGTYDYSRGTREERLVVYASLIEE
ncbi:peptidase C60 [Planococcus glaciei]|uniref:class F sortase n=1 Tax=Planococcus glaciei TaxID=459472 RepID=UPI00069F610A|nr:class F sortase [Planococcus glaciei]KOF10463.1 peptidase C60 [Planococcus glaciei]